MILRGFPAAAALTIVFAGLAGADLSSGLPVDFPVAVELRSFGAFSQLRVTADAPLTVLDPSSDEPLGTSNRVVVEREGGMLRWDSRRFPALRVVGANLTLSAGGRERDYPKSLLIEARKDRLVATNECGLEEYTAGVLASECPASFQPEAIKAMAIAARSYSLRKARVGGTRLCDTVHCQAYRGVRAIPASILAAVRATTGMTAQANGEVIDAVYSSDCGGHTEANEDAWSRTQPKSYLRPVIDAPADGGVSYCASNRSHAWSYLLTPERLRSLAGSTAEEVELEVIDTSASGRVRRLELRAGRGPDETGSTPRVFTGDGWRRLLGPNQLKSLRFEVKRRPDGVELVGHGWGHGVGLCQFGAQGMARSGADHTEILRHYYTGITIGRFQTGVAVPSTTYKPHRDDTRVPAVSANAAVPPAKRARPSPRAGLRPSRTGRRPDSAASTRG